MPVDRQTRTDPDAPVTILLASYRGARFIGAQLDSIAAQTHRDWQLIVSDDGSDDGTPKIIADFAASRPAGQVRIVRGPSRGDAELPASAVDRARWPNRLFRSGRCLVPRQAGPRPGRAVSSPRPCALRRAHRDRRP
ncbi:glycosyltransferase [Paracoccus aerius]